MLALNVGSRRALGQLAEADGSLNPFDLEGKENTLDAFGHLANKSRSQCLPGLLEYGMVHWIIGRPGRLKGMLSI